MPKLTFKGLCYLQFIRKIHREMKAGNVLCDREGHAKKRAGSGPAGHLTSTFCDARQKGSERRNLEVVISTSEERCRRAGGPPRNFHCPFVSFALVRFEVYREEALPSCRKSLR
ncbi:Serine/threonine-protein kinase 3 [Liparis tanakae]|uniref:Serine/threonine-protein kinase 3 n=1 Tax=Liparis tanakae TaxID=230148 RepID=A0A4Z2FMP4_9TELE|nr:Serine/threonine-protein kinase 3 [Liparis tanakae]